MMQDWMKIDYGDIQAQVHWVFDTDVVDLFGVGM